MRFKLLTGLRYMWGHIPTEQTLEGPDMILIQPSPSLPPSPLQQNSQLYEHLEPKFSGQWERKELNHRDPYFLFSSNS